MKNLLIESELDGTMVEFKTTDAIVYEPVLNILKWIEDQGLNIESIFFRNTSPVGDDSPEYDEFIDMQTITAEEYLDVHFMEVSTTYFKEIICK